MVERTLRHWLLVSTLVVGVSVGCVRKPEGPAERIGRSIDEISAALDDMGRSNEGERERMRRERERREREAAARRARTPRLDDSLSADRDEFGDDEPFDDEFDSSFEDDDPLDDSLDRPRRDDKAYQRSQPPIDRGDTRY
jgi:hypothetical protein